MREQQCRGVRAAASVQLVLPLLLGQPVMRFIRMTEHAGRPQIPDPLENTRTTRVAWPWRLLAWNMNFHAEHHLLPSVPFHALPRFNALLQGRIPVRGGYREGHREILACLRGQASAGASAPPACSAVPVGNCLRLLRMPRCHHPRLLLQCRPSRARRGAAS